MNPQIVSIPSRGSGKGDLEFLAFKTTTSLEFQSPLGEVVKETYSMLLSLPSFKKRSFNPLSGKW